MPLLKNARHEQFAELVALKGGDATAHYRKVYPKVKTAKAAYAGASRLLRLVKVRVEEIQEEVKAKGVSKKVMDMQERRERLARMVRADVHNFDFARDGDLLQELVIEEDEETGKKIIKAKLPGKLQCIMADAELNGELIKKEEVKVEGTWEPLEVVKARVKAAVGRHRRE